MSDEKTADASEELSIEDVMAVLDSEPEPDESEMPDEPERIEEGALVAAEPPPRSKSRVLAGLAEDRRPTPVTACETCPNCVWFSSSVEVKAYCRVMYTIVWASTKPMVIEACDGMFLGQQDG